MISDSGERREFSTGAVRDVQEGKGRCDLLPLWDISGVLATNPDEISVVTLLCDYQYTHLVSYLYKALANFIRYDWAKYDEEMPYKVNCFEFLLELSKHYEEGATKYEERNWEKGIPTHCYFDSALRHYFKYMAGHTDEHHDRAFAWNILGLAWTVYKFPELDDLKYYDKKE